MIRVIAFLIAIGLCALGAIWLADRPGEVAITWQGWRVETSVMLLIVAVTALCLIAIAVFSVLRFVMRIPRHLSGARRRRRFNRGLRAVSHGLVAIAAGDAIAARRHALKAQRAAPGEPLTLLLRAQTAQLAGDRNAAAEAFEAMTRRDDTRLLGLRGLFIEAQRRDDAAAARRIAEEAAKAAPALTWAAQATLEFRCVEQDWEGALALLSEHLKNRLIDKPGFQRQRAVLLTARALSAPDSERTAARQWVMEAVKLAPALVPAAALAGRMLSESGETKRAGRILEAAWKAFPHPDLADAFAHVRLSDSARDRLRRIQRLALHHPGHLESALAVARAALDAREFPLARSALAPFAASPTQRVAMLMAELEKLEHGDEGRAREWIARAVHAIRDPAWTADGIVSEQWRPVSPVTGRIDAFEWRAPLSELASPAAEPAEPAPSLASLPEPAAKPEPGPESAKASPRQNPQAPAPVIPLMHAPDDPGPAPESYTEAELVEPSAGERWRNAKSLFR